MTHLSLFSGIGGIDLAAHWAGFETVAFVERDPFCQKVLAKNFPGVPIHDDVETFSGTSFRGTTLVSGGFPCQPFSHAGKRRGKKDDRHLWPHMLRVIAEARPAFVLGENVAGFVGMALDDCLADLEAQGYEALAFVLPACAIGANHRRDRCFIVAKNLDDSMSGGHLLSEGGVQAEPHQDGEEDGLPGETSADVAYSTSVRREACDGWEQGIPVEKGRVSQPAPRGDVAHATRIRQQHSVYAASHRPIKAVPAKRSIAENQGDFFGEVRAATFVRAGNGIPNRVDRVRALGNAVVPQQVYPILKAIADEVRQ